MKSATTISGLTFSTPTRRGRNRRRLIALPACLADVEIAAAMSFGMQEKSAASSVGTRFRPVHTVRSQNEPTRWATTHSIESDQSLRCSIQKLCLQRARI
jgi:hypothetical protein